MALHQDTCLPLGPADTMLTLHMGIKNIETITKAPYLDSYQSNERKYEQYVAAHFATHKTHSQKKQAHNTSTSRRQA